MPSYAILLGRQPKISLAELSCAVPGWEFKKLIKSEWALFESAVPLTQAFFDRLGGSIVMAEKITKSAVEVEDIPKILANEVGPTRKKVTFALRTVGLDGRKVKNLYRECKIKLKSKDTPSRYIGTDRKPAVPGQLHDEGMIGSKYGCELTILQTEDDLWIGRTVAAQDVAEYTKRDIEKPVKDKAVGLLPPKLAQIMLNFGEWMARDPKAKILKKIKFPTHTVFDPFCGTGVIPLECLLRHHNVLASDISKKAVNDTEKNIEWMRKEWKILKKDAAADAWKQDATKEFKLKNLPDVVVTETSLGPNLEKRASKTDAQKNRKESEALQEGFLRNAAVTLPGVPLVCTWPCWKQKEGWIKLEKIWELLPEIGYEAVLPEGIEPEGSRISLFYRRPDHLVGREIVLLKPIQ